MFHGRIGLFLVPLTVLVVGGTAHGAEVAVTKDVALPYPSDWEVSRPYRNAHQLLKPAPQASLPPLVRALLTTELRRSHAEAVDRLVEIAREGGREPTVLAICGWPAIQRRWVAPKPQPGWSGVSRELELRLTTAVAVGERVLRLDATVSPQAPEALVAEVESVGRGFRCPAPSRSIGDEIERLRRAVNLPPPEPTPEEPSSGRPSARGAGAASASAPGNPVLARTGVGELEIAVSPDGQNIVVAANSGRAVSSNGGLTFVAGGGPPTANFGDPSLAVGQSGTFYWGYINRTAGCTTSPLAGCATGIAASTDGGQTFTFRANAVSCPTSGPGLCFPDQEHIAADPVNAAPGNNDQVYSVWRNFAATFTQNIVCSQDSGVTWTAPAVLGSGDFPRITVGQDGSVYVVYRSGGNIMLNKYSSCTSGLSLQAGFPVTVAGFADVACPMPGLDRCNNGNVLSSPTVAVDDTDPSHVYVAFATNTSGSNDDVMVADSTDGGMTWSSPVRVNTNVTGRRFMPWVCAVGGVARVGWYDRRAAQGGPSNDLTDYYCGSASRTGAGLVAGTEVNVSVNADPQCSSGWPCGVRSSNDSEGCSVQPQLAGICRANCGSPSPSDSGQRCDFSNPNCPVGETCCTASGCPKYGDYNGIACGAGRVYVAWASATAPPGLPNPGGLAVFFDTKLAGAAPDLRVTKSDTPDPVVAGTALSYGITVTNDGPASALDVSWTDTLPPGTVFQSLNVATGWSCTTPLVGGTGSVTCSKPFLADGESGSFTLTVEVGAGQPDGSTITNIAAVSQQDTDPNPGNDSAIADTKVATRADLVAQKSDSPDPVIAGTLLTYSLGATNQGPSEAQNLVLSDPLPANTVFSSVSTSGGGSCSTPAPGTNGTVTCSWPGGTAVGETRSVTIVAQVLPSAPHMSVLSNTGTAASDTTDPDASDDTASVNTTVLREADLAVTKNATPDPVLDGALLSFHVVLSNLGPSDADHPVMSEAVPVFTTFDSVSAPAGWSCVTPPLGGTGTVICDAPSIAAGTDASFVIRVRVANGAVSGTVIANTVTVSSDTDDPDPANNPSSVETLVVSPVPSLSWAGLALGVVALLAAAIHSFGGRRRVG